MIELLDIACIFLHTCNSNAIDAALYILFIHLLVHKTLVQFRFSENYTTFCRDKHQYFLLSL